MIHWRGILVIKDRKILTDKEFNKDFFALPGGGQEPNENDNETICREVKEELGFDLKAPYKLFLETELPGKGENEIVHFKVYIVDIPEINSLVKIGPDIEKIEWVNYQIVNDKKLSLGHLIERKILPLLKFQNLID